MREAFFVVVIDFLATQIAIVAVKQVSAVFTRDICVLHQGSLRCETKYFFDVISVVTQSGYFVLAT